jgi:hypothetical protein
MQRPDTEDGLFHGGDPFTGQRGTQIPVAFLNALLGISTIFRGETEPPDPELGDDNDLYICQGSRNFYDKVAGAWEGPWAQGVAGARGFRWYQGEGGAVDQPGQADGDFYLDKSNGDVWQLQEGVWTTIGNIRGIQGVPGEVTVTAEGLPPWTEIEAFVDASAGDQVHNIVAANNGAAVPMIIYKDDATANVVRVIPAAGTIEGLAEWPLDTQYSCLRIRPRAANNTWYRY